METSRTEAVANIKVTVNDKVFDGDEVSQTRMARTIAILGETEEQLWVLADNTPTMTTKAELVEALRLAGLEQTRLWVYA
jgi:biopolymer transport protein ExbD